MIFLTFPAASWLIFMLLSLVLDVVGKAVSEGHLVDLLPLAKMMMVENDSKQLGADAPPEVVVQVMVDLSPHHLRPPAV
jgi:hypothetical protein